MFNALYIAIDIKYSWAWILVLNYYSPLYRNLQTESHKLKMLCASAIFRLAEEDDSRHLVRLHGGLDLLGT